MLSVGVSSGAARGPRVVSGRGTTLGRLCMPTGGTEGGISVPVRIADGNGALPGRVDGTGALAGTSDGVETPVNAVVGVGALADDVVGIVVARLALVLPSMEKELRSVIVLAANATGGSAAVVDLCDPG